MEKETIEFFKSRNFKILVAAFCVLVFIAIIYTIKYSLP